MILNTFTNLLNSNYNTHNFEYKNTITLIDNLRYKCVYRKYQCKGCNLKLNLCIEYELQYYKIHLVHAIIGVFDYDLGMYTYYNKIDFTDNGRIYNILEIKSCNQIIMENACL